MTLSDELAWRGLYNQMTFADIKEVDQPRTFYFGVDPSSDSMTIGNLAAAMMVRHFIDHGHKAILLVGGATGKIGDPDGKKTERDLKTNQEVEKNKAAIIKQYQTIFEGKDFEIVDNYDWLKDVSFLDFLQNIGKHVSMTQLLDREFVQSRIGKGGSGISYAEFSYALLQGYDFLHLFRQKDVSLQVCGADQWGNSITGASLIRKLESKQVHVYSVPLVVNKSTGIKFGKSEAGAIWLDATKTSPYTFYQFWLNVDDDGVIDYLKIYTLLTLDEVKHYQDLVQTNPGGRGAQKTLAYEVTKLIHGQAQADSVRDASALLFGSSTDMTLTDEVVDVLARELSVASLGQTVVQVLVDSELVASNGEAKRLMASGAISINGEKITEDIELFEACLVKKGKNSFVLVR